MSPDDDSETPDDAGEPDEAGVEQARQVAEALDEVGTDRLADAVTEAFVDHLEQSDKVDVDLEQAPEADDGGASSGGE